MKRAKLISAIFLLTVTTGCGGSKRSAEDLITVDVNASYPQKELILQDIMDVEYIPLETTDEFITKGTVKAIGKDILLIKGGTNGDILVFDRPSGKGLRKINRMGQSGEEYSNISDVILDEENKEMYVADFPARKILVYDLQGNFHRSFPFADTSHYQFLSNYDKDNLICFKGYAPAMESEQSCHVLISKKNGSITKEIKIPFKEVKSPVLTKDEYVITPNYCLVAPYQDSWLLTRGSSDTIYNYLPDGSILPLIARTPSIHSMDPEIFLFPTVVTDHYCFMHTMKKEVDFKTFRGFNGNYLVYDKQDKAIYECTIYNDDYQKQEVSLQQRPESYVNKEVAAFEPLDAADLAEANEKGKLKGKLKEIATGLNEESNPVIMLIKNKAPL